MKKFEETREPIEAFLNEFLVVCPRCQRRARITQVNTESKDLFAPRRLLCPYCGLTRQWAEKNLAIGNSDALPTDACFNLPLWLVISCCGHTLWAYNLAHLTLIENYVSALLRQHIRDEEKGWHNQGLVNRLPKWMISAKNRAAVLKAIAQLKAKV